MLIVVLPVRSTTPCSRGYVPSCGQRRDEASRRGLIGAWHRTQLRFAHRPALVTHQPGKATKIMITLGIDAHKRSHTVVALDALGRQLGTETTRATTTSDHLSIVRWADQFGAERTWAVEDCRHLSRRLVARAALREPDLPTAYPRPHLQINALAVDLDGRTQECAHRLVRQQRPSPTEPSREPATQRSAALHRIALTQARHHPDARALIDRRTSDGDSGKEAIRVLKRRLSDVVFRAMAADLNARQNNEKPPRPLAD